MIRTNQSFLSYAEMLYTKQQNSKEISEKHFIKGQKLLSQDERAGKVMLIKEGITKCYLSEDNEKDYIIEFLGSGEIIGEIECLKNIPCLCSVEAITAVTVLAFSVPFFRHLLQTDLQVNNLLLQTFAGRIINTSVRASYQQLYTVEHSLKKLLALQSKYELQLTKEEMASYLGVTIRTLNRSLKNLSV